MCICEICGSELCADGLALGIHVWKSKGGALKLRPLDVFLDHGGGELSFCRVSEPSNLQIVRALLAVYARVARRLTGFSSGRKESSEYSGYFLQATDIPAGKIYQST